MINFSWCDWKLACVQQNWVWKLLKKFASEHKQKCKRECWNFKIYCNRTNTTHNINKINQTTFVHMYYLPQCTFNSSHFSIVSLPKWPKLRIKSSHVDYHTWLPPAFILQPHLLPDNKTKITLKTYEIYVLVLRYTLCWSIQYVTDFSNFTHSQKPVRFPVWPSYIQKLFLSVLSSQICFSWIVCSAWLKKMHDYW